MAAFGRADDDASRANADGDTFPPVAMVAIVAKVSIPVPVTISVWNPEIDLGHLQICRLGRNAK